MDAKGSASNSGKSQEDWVREQKKPDQGKEQEEESLDRTIEDSFPASDPPSTIPDPDEDAA